MTCPSCGGKLRVIDVVRNSEKVYRRRKCKKCGQLVFTLESQTAPDDEYRSSWVACVHNNRNQTFMEEKT